MVYIIRALTAINHVISLYSISSKLLEVFCSRNCSEAVQKFLVEAKYLFYKTNQYGRYVAVFKTALNSRLLLLDYVIIGRRRDVP